MFALDNKTFILAKIGLLRVGCPSEVEDLPSNRASGFAIVAVKNEKKLGYIEATKYCPNVIVVAGGKRRELLLAEGIVASWAYVQADVININADDAISSNELMEKLNELLRERFYGNKDTGGGCGSPCGSALPYPYIFEVYPFENYFIYSMKGQKYRQAFALDPIERKVGLRGGSIMVMEKFVDACGDAPMPRVQTGVRYAFAPIRGMDTVTSRGAKNSELITQVIRNWANIDAAITAFQAYRRSTTNRAPMTPAFQPVALAGNKIQAKLAAKGIDMYEFAVWSAKAQTDKFWETSASLKKKLEKGQKQVKGEMVNPIRPLSMGMCNKTALAGR